MARSDEWTPSRAVDRSALWLSKAHLNRSLLEAAKAAAQDGTSAVHVQSINACANWVKAGTSPRALARPSFLGEAGSEREDNQPPQGHLTFLVVLNTCAAVRMTGSLTLGGGCVRSKVKMSMAEAWSIPAKKRIVKSAPPSV